MEFRGIEKLQGVKNQNIWKFTVRNLLHGAEDAYEQSDQFLITKFWDIDFKKSGQNKQC